jgi:hypothetical protein
MPEINLHVDGPHSPESIREAADLAAEAIRYLCHATMPGSGGLINPADTYSLLGALYTGTERLPQLLMQLTSFLAAQAASGTLADDHGRDVATLTAEASYNLGTAHQLAADLTKALQNAQQAITGLYVRGES